MVACFCHDHVCFYAAAWYQAFALRLLVKKVRLLPLLNSLLLPLATPHNDDKTECMKNNEEICKSHQTLIPFPESHVFLLLRLFISLFFLWHRIILERKFSKFAVFIPLRCSFGTTSNCPPFQRRLAKRLFVGRGFTIPYARCMEYVPTNLPQIYGIHVW